MRWFRKWSSIRSTKSDSRTTHRFARLWLCCFALVLVAGCAAMDRDKQRTPSRVEPKKAPPKSTSIPKKKVPGPKDWGPEINMKHWVIQCSSPDLAMVCRKSDRTDKRCAVRRKGKFLWTYASYCHRAALPCYRKACN